MNDTEIRTRAKEIMTTAVNSVLTTIDSNGFPQPRTMWTAAMDDDFTIYYITHKELVKCRQIEANPKVCSFWTMVEGTTVGWSYVLVKGEASLHDSPELRERFWNDMLLKYFPGGKTDPGMVFIILKPKELMMMDGYKYPLDRIEF